MLTVKLIRSYKIYLWAKRLGIKEEYAETEIDITGFCYVHSIIPVDDLSSKVIIITPVASSKGRPIPVIFEAPNSTINLLIETFEIEETNGRTSRSSTTRN